MTIAQLFVKIGFQVQNAESLDKAVAQLGFGEMKAVNMKHAVAGLGAAFAGLMYFTASTATNLYKFGLATGLSTRMLQDWQFAGARAGVTASEIADSIKGIQDAQVQIQMGQGNLAPWALLGIDPRQDPMKVLWLVHERVKQSAGLSASMGRFLAGQLGLGENMFQMLRRDNLELGALEEKFKITEDAQKKADELNGKWLQMRQKLEELAVQFGITFGPKIISLMENLQKPGGPFDRFVNWLQRVSADTEDGAEIRSRLVHIAEGVGILAGALTALSVAGKAVGTVSAILALLGIGGKAAGGAAAAEAAAGGGGAAGLGTLATGGVMAAGGFAGYKLAEKGSTTVDKIQAFLAVLASQVVLGSRKDGNPYIHIQPNAEATAPDSSHFLPPWLSRILDSDALKPMDFRGRGFNGAGQGGDVNVTVNQTINGAGDPKAVGKESASAMRKAVDQSMSDYVNQNAVGATAH